VPLSRCGQSARASSALDIQKPYSEQWSHRPGRGRSDELNDTRESVDIHGNRCVREVTWSGTSMRFTLMGYPRWYGSKAHACCPYSTWFSAQEQGTPASGSRNSSNSLFVRCSAALLRRSVARTRRWSSKDDTAQPSVVGSWAVTCYRPFGHFLMRELCCL
jgi:hypothetical protein